MFSDIDPALVVAALIGLVGTIAGLLARRTSTRTDAASRLTDGAMGLVNELQEEQKRLRAAEAEMRQRIEALEAEQARERAETAQEREANRQLRVWYDAWTNVLVETLHRHGIEVPTPPPRPDVPDSWRT